LLQDLIVNESKIIVQNCRRTFKVVLELALAASLLQPPSSAAVFTGYTCAADGAGSISMLEPPSAAL
jgi:hypothetical protein